MSLIVIAQNITDPETHALVREDGTSLYDVEVSINRKKFIWCGKIDNHKRDDGAAALLRRIADKMELEGELTSQVSARLMEAIEAGAAKVESVRSRPKPKSKKARRK